MGILGFNHHLRSRLADLCYIAEFHCSDRRSCHCRCGLRRNLRRQLHHHCVFCPACEASKIWCAPGKYVWHCVRVRTAHGRSFHRSPHMAMVLLHQPPARWRSPRGNHHFLQTRSTQPSTFQPATQSKAKTAGWPWNTRVRRLHQLPLHRVAMGRCQIHLVLRPNRCFVFRFRYRWCYLDLHPIPARRNSNTSRTHHEATFNRCWSPELLLHGWCFLHSALLCRYLVPSSERSLRRLVRHILPPDGPRPDNRHADRGPNTAVSQLYPSIYDILRCPGFNRLRSLHNVDAECGAGRVDRISGTFRTRPRSRLAATFFNCADVFRK